MKQRILLAVLPKLGGLLFLLSLNINAQTTNYRERINLFLSTNENGAAYDALTTRAQRDSYIIDKLIEDWVDTVPYNADPPWVCDQTARQLQVNFFGTLLNLYDGYNGLNIDSIHLHQGTLAHNGKYGLPILYVLIDYWDHEQYAGQHAMNAIITGDNVLQWNDWNFIEPQRDQMNVQPGQAYMPGIFETYFGRDTLDGIIEIRAPIYYQSEDDIRVNNVIMVWYSIKDGVPSILEQPGTDIPHPLLIIQRDTLNPEINIISPINGEIYNSSPKLEYTFIDSTLKYAWYSIDNGKTKVDLYKDWYEFAYVNGIGYKYVAVYNPYGTVDINLNDGNYELIISATDYFNLETSDTINFTVDKTPPTVNVFAPLPNYTYRQDTVKFTFTISEQNLDLPNSYFSFNGVKTSLSDNTGKIPLTSREGVNTVEIHVHDLATNVTIKTITYTLDTQSGVNDLQSTNEVVFYPNPVKDIGVFKFENEEKEPLKIELYDVSGRLLSHITFQTDLIKIDFSQYSSGIITYKVRNSKRTIKVGSIIKE